MDTKWNAAQRRKESRKHLRDTYKVSIEQELRDAIVSRALGKSYNRVLNGAYGYIVDCQPDDSAIPLRPAGRSGRCRTVELPMAK